MYYLIIDTETSGLPKDWTLSYDQDDNWPFAFQIAWAIYDADGRHVNSVNYYVQDAADKVAADGSSVHKLTKEIVHAKGVSRQSIMAALTAAIQEYKPIIVGHFVRYDYHILQAEFVRAGMASPLDTCTYYCTMTSSSVLAQKIGLKYFRLWELYRYLFFGEPSRSHDAEADVDTTAKCFFKMKESLLFSDEDIIAQLPLKEPKKEKKMSAVWLSISVMLLLFLVSYFAYYLSRKG